MPCVSTHPGYEQFYLNNNPADTHNYKRKARGYERKLQHLLPQDRSIRILDLGCGSGLLTYFLWRLGYRNIIGVDVNEELLAIARQNVPAEFVLDDATHYVAAAQSQFDVIFLMDVLEHIPKGAVVDFLRNLADLLNPGGFILIRTPNQSCLASAAQFYDDFTHCTHFTERSLEQVARQAGFLHVIQCDQFRMQNFKGKIHACLNWLLHKMIFRIVGGIRAEVFYRNLYTQLYKHKRLFLFFLHSFAIGGDCLLGGNVPVELLDSLEANPD